MLYALGQLFAHQRQALAYHLAGAVVKNPSNQDIVWVHTGPEVFEARPVRTLALDGARVSVVNGLKAGDRVVTQGAPLVNQVR